MTNANNLLVYHKETQTCIATHLTSVMINNVFIDFIMLSLQIKKFQNLLSVVAVSIVMTIWYHEKSFKFSVMLWTAVQ